MTAGLPGAGIGGMFYMLTAIGMPFHAAFHAAKRRIRGRAATEPAVDWRSVIRQFSIAVGILGALWFTGWLLALLIVSYPETLGSMKPPGGGHRVPNVLRMGALILSVGTLFIVLVSVQLARLLVRRRTRDVAVAAALFVAIVFTPGKSTLAQVSPGASSDSAASHLRAAEAAYDSGDTEVAITEYSAVLASEPENSRALFRLGQLTRRDLRRSAAFFRRYVAVVPGDAWGYIALADELALDGRYSDALREYDSAARLAPGERDVAIGRTRVFARAGYTDDAIAALEEWTRANPNDAEALRDLGDQRRRAGRFSEAAAAYRMSAAREAEPRTTRRLDAVRATAAPAVEVTTAGAGDSDQNRSYRVGALASAGIGDRARAVLSGGWKSIDGFTTATLYDASLGVTARPKASFRFEANAGLVRSSADTSGLTTTPIASISAGAPNGPRLSTIPGKRRGSGGSASAPPPGTVIHVESPADRTTAIGLVRGVWKQPGGAGMVDVRASRMLLDATGVLVLNRVVRNEVAGRADIPLGRRIKIRGGAKADSYDGISDSNTRIALLGGVAVSATDAVEVSGIFQRLAFDHSTTSGYFAPRVAQLAEIGSYAELESDRGTVLALDGGFGGQRFADFGAAMGSWKPAFRLFAQLTVPIKPGSEFRAELDSYDSRLGSEAASSTSWRYASASVSLRIALR